MKIATWNVNSLKVRLPQVMQWLAAHPVDVLCLQETKLIDTAFPKDTIEAAGYQVCFAGQKTYNGVAILSRLPMTDILPGIDGYVDEQKRVLSATVESDVGAVRIVCAYVPNGQSVGSEKYAYKLSWLEAFTAHLRNELALHPQLAVLGDFNVAPEDRDVKDPAAWAGEVLVSEPERAAFQGLIQLGLADAFRLFSQPDKMFSWWDYRQLAFQRNRGLRIDHILLSPALASRCMACHIDKEPRKNPQPSDHTPVIAQMQ